MYDGTDTRTPCDKMTWIVYKQPQYIEEKEFERFLELVGTSKP